GSPQEEQNRKAYDYMPLSKEKIVSLGENIAKEESLVSYIFPILRYHARVWELEGKDFAYLFADRHYPLKGYAYSDKTAQGLPRFDMNAVVHQGIAIAPENREYMERIRDLCEQEQIRLLLIKTPNIEWGIHEHEGMVALADELDVPFVDYNTFFRELGINEDACFLDGAHLNAKGARLLSLDLGKRVLQLLDEIPQHTKSTQRVWESDLAFLGSIE
ncbi:MAG: hypothetical protein J6P60_00530, partial [Lachnospiraceae bacterium]|nr:hypothetical protein [Lachnospiraceae bacterium]